MRIGKALQCTSSFAVIDSAIYRAAPLSVLSENISLQEPALISTSVSYFFFSTVEKNTSQIYMPVSGLIHIHFISLFVLCPVVFFFLFYSISCSEKYYLPSLCWSAFMSVTVNWRNYVYCSLWQIKQINIRHRSTVLNEWSRIVMRMSLHFS